MIKKRLYISIISAVIIILATAFIIFENQHSSENTFDIDLYFFNDSETSITAEKRTLKYDDEKTDYNLVLDELLKGPQDSKNKPIFEKGTKILSTDKFGKDLTVNCSTEYLTPDNSKIFPATYAIVKSLCQLEDIDRVKVTVDGNDIVSSDGTIIGLLSDADIDLVSDDTTKDSKEIKLYFGDKNSNKLVSETRTVKITDTLPTEQYVITELIKGAELNGSKSLLSPDTELISAQTTDGTCFVNFKSGFLEKNLKNNPSDRLVIYSIVNSLCELKNVSFVQFLVDGKKLDKLGEIDLSAFFIENKNLIK